MQFVNGSSLKEASAKMTLEEKLLVLQKIAEAVHAAHTHGLIHRDLKPTNVLVEDRSDGWHPYVVDFGLARDQESPGATRTGIIVGSPSYMAPEQARGEIRNLDRRTDVYALGATLYELLCQEPPFQGLSSTEVLVQILQQDPVPVRQKNPSISRELETIVMKCLEKDQAKRYSSARALAEDIQRYLNGDPIHAKPQRWFEQGLKLVRKHALLTITVSIALLTVSFLLVLWLRERLHSIEQARIAQSFGQEASNIKSILRSTYTLPLHDLTPEKKIIHARIEEIGSKIRKSGSLARGPGFHAMGEGFLELGDYRLAKQKLEEAWKSDYQTPEVALALGRTLGYLYEIELKKANELKGNEREQHLRFIEKEFRNPALDYLALSEGARTDSPALWKGYISFYDHRYDDALNSTRESMSNLPWLYEAWMLQGDIFLAVAVEKQRKELWKESLSDFSKAEAAYRTALNVARSDPRLYQRDCERALQVIEVKAKIERSFPAIRQDELMSCDRLVQVESSLPDGYFQKSRIYFRVASARSNEGIDANEWFQNAIRAGEEAVKRNPADPALYKFITLSYAWLAHLLTEQGADPTATLKKLIEFSQKEGSLHMVAVAHHQSGMYRMQIGLDPMQDFKQALKGFEQAQIQTPGSMEHSNRLGKVKTAMAEYLFAKGQDAGKLIEEAVQDYNKVIAKFPKYPDPYCYLSHAFNTQASFEISHRKNPEELLRKAILHANKATELDPHHAEGYLELGKAFILQGESARMTGKDASSYMKQSVGALQKALEENPRLIEGYLKAAQVHLLLSEMHIQNRSIAQQERSIAEDFLKKASSLNPNHPEINRIKTQLLKEAKFFKSG